MTNPRALAEEAKVILEARDRDRTHYEDCWRDHPDCLAAFLADALLTALDDVEEQRGNAEGFWEARERFRQALEQISRLCLALTETPERERGERRE